MIVPKETKEIPTLAIMLSLREYFIRPLFFSLLKLIMIYDIAIIGGGISGLYCALKLSFSHKVILFEKNDYLG